jgi:hypothetical protein
MVSGVVWSANGKWSGVECKWEVEWCGVQMVSGVVWSANGKWSGVECKW